MHKDASIHGQKPDAVEKAWTASSQIGLWGDKHGVPRGPGANGDDVDLCSATNVHISHSFPFTSLT